MTEQKPHSFSLDLMRCAAVLMVISVHFFQNIGFYTMPMAGKTMAVSAVARMCLMVCVPLFMMLSGRLCTGREYGKGYYRKLLPILLIYVLAGAACLAFRVLWRKEEISSLTEYVKQFLTFSAAPYGWYVRMYVGLFLLIPFINAAWRGLDDRGRRNMVVTLVALASLPTVTNLRTDVWSDWWVKLYPVMYYVLGAWLGEHPLKWKKCWLCLGWVGLAAVVAGFRYRTIGGGTFTWDPISDWWSLPVVGESVCAWCLLSRCTGEGWPGPVKRLVSRTAKASLTMYLISYIPDKILYPLLQERVPVFRDQLLCLPVMAAAVALCALLLAWPIDRAVGEIMKRLPGNAEAAGNTQDRGTKES